MGEIGLATSLVSVSVGLPREVVWKGREVSTGIFKSPVDGPVMLRRHNLDGDQQADLSVHGGPTKAVYLYPVQHYDYWRDELQDEELAWGNFGENFTAEGVDEESVCIGDEFRVGGAHVVVTCPHETKPTAELVSWSIRYVGRRSGMTRGRWIGSAVVIGMLREAESVGLLICDQARDIALEST